MPFAFIVAIGPAATQGQHRFQGEGPQSMGLLFALPEGHSSALSLGRRLTQPFMLMTWLFSVSRSIRAAVRGSFLRKEPHSEKPRLGVMRVGFFLCRSGMRGKTSPTCTGS